MPSSPAENPESALLKRIDSADLTGLMAIWAGRRKEDWANWPETYRRLTKAALAQGEPLFAYDVVAEALTLWPSEIRLRQLQGLALARSGATERANSILQELRHEGA